MEEAEADFTGAVAAGFMEAEEAGSIGAEASTAADRLAGRGAAGRLAEGAASEVRAADRSAEVLSAGRAEGIPRAVSADLEDSVAGTAEG